MNSGAGAGPTSAAPWTSGLLAVDKPTGMTSHDVVERVRRRLRIESAGHLGTLDPLASGLLLIALGPATRLVSALQGGEKTYEATIRFGLVTTTQDLGGETLSSGGIVPAEGAISAASAAFVGEIHQVPPMASALKVAGQRLHRLHRRGVTVARAPRRVTVRSWEWVAWELPDATFRVRCQGGTYVRTLAHDLGQALGCGAALASLRRLRSEPFGLERSVTLERIVHQPPEAWWADAGYSVEQATEHLPGLRLTREEEDAVAYGRSPGIALERAAGLPIAAGARSIVLHDAGGRVLGLGELEAGEGPGLRICPHALLPWAIRSGGPGGLEAGAP